MKKQSTSSHSSREKGADAKREVIKREVEALFSEYDSTASRFTRKLQELIDSRSLAKSLGTDQHQVRHHCPQAKMAYDVLVSAHSTYITPAGQKWFSFKSRDSSDYGSKTAKIDWYSKLTEITNTEMSESNFYTTIQEVFSDRCLGGTGLFFIGGSETEDLHFIHIEEGLFAIAEDHKKQVNTVARKFRMSAQQAAGQWGENALPEKVHAAYIDPSRRHTEKFTFIHYVRPRKGAISRKAQDVHQGHRPIEGFYLEEESYAIIAEEGFYEFPYCATRFLRGNDSPYGVSPGMGILPVIEQLMKLERLMDVQAEVAAFPRILQLAKQNRQIDLRAGGKTTITKEEAQMGYPRELASSSNYNIGLERIQAKEEIIKGAFYVNMLNAISSVDRQMTATEINAREAEKVLAFSPSFTLFISDFKVAFRRIIAILFRQGKIPEQGMPQELMNKDKRGNVTILNPNIMYLGKIAQAIERVQRRGIEDVLTTVIQYTQMTGDTRMIETIKPHLVARYILESSGAPTDIMMNDAEIAEMEAAKLAAAQQEASMMKQQEQIAALEGLSKANAEQKKGEIK